MRLLLLLLLRCDRDLYTYLYFFSTPYTPAHPYVDYLLEDSSDSLEGIDSGICSQAAAILTVLAVMSLTIAPEDAVSNAAVADQRDSGQKDQAADGARLAFQKEANQVEYYEHDMCLH